VPWESQQPRQLEAPQLPPSPAPQAPAVQAWPEPHAWQVAPPTPQAPAAVPVWHAPPVLQQPLQLDAKQPAEVGLHEGASDAAKPNAKPSSVQRHGLSMK
jgi:hypothetical protein